jgi:uncharacterized protein YbjT (DUF2867 family)
MRGIDTVLLVSPAVPAQEIAVIDSAARQGVSHVIKVTSKASADSPVGRRRGQAQIEAHLETTGLAYTLLRSNAYMQNLLALAPMIRQTGGFLMSAGDGQAGTIDARDVAATAAAIATAPKEHAGRTYRLTGPSLITHTDIASQLSAALGHPVEHRQISPAEHRAAMIAAGIPEAVATSNAQAFGLIAEGDAAWLSDDVKSITGTAPRPLRTFIADHLRAFHMIPGTVPSGYAGPATPMTTWTTQRTGGRNTTCRNTTSFRGTTASGADATGTGGPGHGLRGHGGDR